MADLTITQVAQRFGVTKQTIENRIRANLFAPHDYRVGDKGWRFWYRETVERYLFSRKTVKNHKEQ